MLYLIRNEYFHTVMLEIYGISAEPYGKDNLLVRLDEEVKAIFEADGIECTPFKVSVSAN